MKKYILPMMLWIGLILGGCGSAAGGGRAVDPDPNADPGLANVDSGPSGTDGLGLSGPETALVIEGEGPEISQPETSPVNQPDAIAVQGGPFGEISLTLPEGWGYEACPADSDSLPVYGEYGIRFYPESALEGCVALVYTEFFGVCGVGLSEERAVIAGRPASVGTFDNNEYWDFVAFEEDYDGLVALTYDVNGWWDEHGSEVLDILDTVQFAREGGTYILDGDFWDYEIGMFLMLRNISSTGAALIFNPLDAGYGPGELTCGEDFVLERLEGEDWEAVPIALEGNYGFHDIAYILAADGSTELELNWEWLYGELAPGEYRIGKKVSFLPEDGERIARMLYARFVLY